MIELRPYQKSFIEKIKKEMIEGHKHILAQSPVGSGKTIMFTEIVKSNQDKGKRCLILTNRSVLLSQTDNSFDKFGINTEYVNPKYKDVPIGNCVICMAQTLRRRIKDEAWTEWVGSFDIIIIDECHLCDFDFIFKINKLKDIWVIGFTATPIRKGKMKQLSFQYTRLIQNITVNELVSMGFLVNGHYYTTPAPDISNVSISSITGDYNEKQMGDAFSKKEVFLGVVNEYKRLCNNKKAICFCSNIEHTELTVEELNNAGIASKCITSKTPDKERISIFKEFESGEFNILCNCGVLTAGFDCPSIEVVILNRSTTSKALYLQMLGRGSRPYLNKNEFIVLDFGNNVDTHGEYEDDVIFSLNHKVPGNGVAPTKECPDCNNLVLLSAKECPHCGFKFTTNKEMILVELVESKKGIINIDKLSPKQLIYYSQVKKHHMNWVFRVLFARADDFNSFRNDMIEIGYNYPYIYKLYNEYKNEYNYGKETTA